MFDLEKAVAAWRHSFRLSRVFLPDDLDELESHLRDLVDDLQAQGLAPQEAFAAAVRRLGPQLGVEDEYRKVRWGRRKRRRMLDRTYTWEVAMWKNYATIALRGLRRHKGYALINVAGLAVGLAACLVIGLFIQHKLSYDRHFDDVEHLFRIVLSDSAGIPTSNAIPMGLAPALQHTFPDVQAAALVTQPQDAVLRTGDRLFRIEDVVSGSDAFFEVLTFPFLQGDPQHALAGPNRIVLTRSLAVRLFDSADPMGRMIVYEDGSSYLVTGVMEDVPAATHVHFSAILSFSEKQRQLLLGDDVRWRSFNPSYFLYARLRPLADPAAFQANLTAWEQAEEPDKPFLKDVLALQPVTQIHLHASLPADIAPQSDARYLYLFAAVGLLILLIACFNYTNLATARAMHRAREVGIRKVVGARRRQLVGQFLSESLLFGLLALVLALAIALIVLPEVESLTGQTTGTADYWKGTGIALLAGIVLLVGLVAGTYPAFFLSRFRPTQVLTGRGPGLRRGGSGVRRILVVVQFTASIALIIATLIIQTQIDYVQNRRLGFDEEHVVILHDTRSAETQREAFIEQIKTSPYVVAVSLSPPPDEIITARRRILSPETQEVLQLNEADVDLAYAETIGLNILAGRFFSDDRGADSVQSVVLNESAVRSLALGPEPVGQQFVFGRDTYTVSGVVEDFHIASLHHRIEPVLLFLAPPPPRYTLVRLRPGTTQEALAHLADVYERFVPDRPFSFSFLDARLDAFYRSEQQVGRLFTVFSGLAVFIAALGLFGLAAFTAEQRRHELGIRKVLGATVAQLVVLLSKDLVRLVGLAVVVAAPLAYLAMDRWLADFAYRIDISWPIFLRAGLAALGVAVLSVSVQSIRAALANPVESLRHE